jgi:low temperature requirement protein LtrA
MRGEETWSPGAAVAAFSGLGTLFLVWWAYFDIAAGAAERPVRSAGDTVKLRVWAYAHLPLYLAIAVLGVGFEHVIGSAGAGNVHLDRLGPLVAAAGTVVAMLWIIGRTRSAREKPSYGGRPFRAGAGSEDPAYGRSFINPPDERETAVY